MSIIVVTYCYSYKNNKYVGPPYSRTKIYAARMYVARQQQRGEPAPDLGSKSAGRRCCCRSTGQTHRQTDGRTDGRSNKQTKGRSRYYVDRIIKWYVLSP